MSNIDLPAALCILYLSSEKGRHSLHLGLHTGDAYISQYGLCSTKFSMNTPSTLNNIHANYFDICSAHLHNR